ncbi:uncharacterized protein LOC134243227 [Saccostrea cucullata]|uniref:uncharacterized protein LOC134243227 n=1 Tax=Saccostrea cuccullata TaxID=36930 RepID=UPI002ED2A98E
MRCLVIYAALAIFAGQIFAQVTEPVPRNGTERPPIEEKTVAPGGENITGIPTEGDKTPPALPGVDPSPEPDHDGEETGKGKIWKNRIAKWKKMRLNKKGPAQEKPEIKDDEEPGQETRDKAKGPRPNGKTDKERRPKFGKRRERGMKIFP